jgi:hypothetical protein
MNGFPATSPRNRNGKEAGRAVASVPFKSVSDDHIVCSFCLEWFELGTTHRDWKLSKYQGTQIDDEDDPKFRLSVPRK